MNRSILDRAPWPFSGYLRADLRAQAHVIHRPTWGHSLKCERGAHVDRGAFVGCGYLPADCLCECHDESYDFPWETERTVLEPAGVTE